MEWTLNNVRNCSLVLNLPNIIVAPDSRQISATLLVSTEDYRSLLLVYQDHSERVIVMSAYANTSNIWTWRNETSKFYPGLQTTCSAAQIISDTSFDLNCFVRYSKNYASSNVAQVSFPFDVVSSSFGDIEVDDRSFHPSRS